MAHIKVTGYIDTEDVNPDFIDLASPTGLSPEGHEVLSAEIDLDEIEFEVQPG